MSSLADTRSPGLLFSRLPHPSADDSGADGTIPHHTLSSACWTLGIHNSIICASILSALSPFLSPILQHSRSGQLDPFCSWTSSSFCSSCVLYFLLFPHPKPQKRGWCVLLMLLDQSVIPNMSITSGGARTTSYFMKLRSMLFHWNP